MATSFRLPAYAVPNKLLDLAPLDSAIDGYREQMNTNEQFGLRKRQDDRQQEEFDAQKRQRETDRIGKIAQMYLEEPDPARRSAIGNTFSKLHPQMTAKLSEVGIDPNNHDMVAQFLRAETSGYDPLAEKAKRAQIDQTRASTDLARAQTKLSSARAGAIGAPQPAAAPVDPLQNVGLDNEGNVTDIKGIAKPTSQWEGPNEAGQAAFGQKNFSPPMRLGGPMDDIDRSMLPDEGRGQRQGVQVAQAGGNYGIGAGGGPSIVDQARSRAFGPAGVTSPDVPGVVTDAGRNRRVDVPATREAQGQRAIEQSSQEMQDRALRLRREQALWTNIYGKPARAGYYYGPDGREMPMADKNFKGDKESQAVALLNMNKIEEASKKLIATDYVTRTAAGALNIGETGQAFADMKQGALGIAYALSGKTVAVAEMKNFIEAYGPTPGDSADRIKQKTERMRQFYQALLTASRGGEAYETAFGRAMAATGLKNPDGSPAGAPAAASSGAPNQSQPRPGSSSVRDLPTDELVRRLNSGR